MKDPAEFKKRYLVILKNQLFKASLTHITSIPLMLEMAHETLSLHMCKDEAIEAIKELPKISFSTDVMIQDFIESKQV